MSLETLKNAGFVIRKRKEQKYLSNIFQKRYQHIPLEYSHFLQSFKSIQNQDDDVWFVSIEDFNETSKLSDQSQNSNKSSSSSCS